ncbi:MAG TPA: UdgX family uracil-DNA binding protein, partial [Geminicoccaceae bacterium]|nr:UdgX family uracil-DNA binding protein [Geminicoccaceae bacterium]
MGDGKVPPTGQVVYLPPARERPAPAERPPRTLAEAKQAAEACRACALARRAACAVFGEGPQGAPVMLVGEQPGEADEAAGRPFAGAAGKLLDRALGDAGLDRGGLYVTHAVKHFKFARRDGQRVPLRLEPAEIAACRPWLDRERVLVRPHLIVALGAVAAAALLERPVSLPLERGRILPLEDGSRLLVTEHPSTILRLADRTAQGREYRRLVADLLLAVPYLRRAA